MSIRKIVVATGIYPPDIGGPAVYAKMLEDGLRGSQIEAVVVSFSRFLHLPRGARHLRFMGKILACGREADMFLALDPVSVGLPTLLAARVSRRPFALRVGGDYAWEQAVERFGVEEDLDAFQTSTYGWRVELLRRLERAVARRAVRVIVPDRYLQGLLRGWGVPPERIAIVPNAVDAFGIPATRAEARRELGIDGRLVVSAGRLLRLKGFEALVDTIGGLRSEFPDLRLAVIGSGPRLARLEDQVRRSRLEGTVLLLGRLPQARTRVYLKAADVFVLNSAGEGQAHALLEAMTFGTPVIATRVGGTRDLIEHGRTGWLIPYRDPPALAEAIRRFLGDPELAGRLAESATQAVVGFDVSRTVRDTVTALQAAL